MSSQFTALLAPACTTEDTSSYLDAGRDALNQVGGLCRHAKVAFALDVGHVTRDGRATRESDADMGGSVTQAVRLARSPSTFGVQRQLRTSGMSSPYLAMCCLCSISLSRMACCA